MYFVLCFTNVNAFSQRNTNDSKNTQSSLVNHVFSILSISLLISLVWSTKELCRKIFRCSVLLVLSHYCIIFINLLMTSTVSPVECSYRFANTITRRFDSCTSKFISDHAILLACCITTMLGLTRRTQLQRTS